MRFITAIIMGMILLATDVSGQEAKDQGWDLTRCIEYAVLHNITVKQTELNRQTAENNYAQSKVSRFPSLSASGSQSLTRGTSADPITYNFVSQTVRSTSVGLNVQMTLYGGNKISHTIRQNELWTDQYALYTDQARNDISLEITQAYLQALYFKEGVQIAESDLHASEKQLERTQALYDAGSVAAKDLADMRSQYANSRYTLVAARNSFDQQVLTLKQLLELEPEQSFELAFPAVEPAAEITIPDKYAVYKEALNNMPEIKAGKLQQDISALDIKIAKAGYKPTLSLSGSLSTGYTNTQDFTFEEQFDNNYNQRLGLTLSIPIFNNFSTRTSVQNARLAVQSAGLDMMAARKELYQQVENAHQSATASRSEMEAAAEQTEAAHAAYNLAQRQFTLGGISTVDLLIAQNDYLTAQQKYTQTRYNTILYYLLLEFYQGNPIKL